MTRIIDSTTAKVSTTGASLQAAPDDSAHILRDDTGQRWPHSPARMGSASTATSAATENIPAASGGLPARARVSHRPVRGRAGNGKRIRDPRKAQWRMQQAKRHGGLRLFVEGDEETVFHFPDALLSEVAQLIAAYQAYGATRKSVPLPAAA